VIGSLVMVAVVVGVAGGLATGLAAGAKRTSTAADRFLSEARLLDVMITDPSLTVEQAEEIRQLPGVEGAALLTGLGMVPHGGPFVNVTASVDGHYGVDIDVPRVVRGRAADPDAADELVLNETTAEVLGADVGTRLRFDTWSPEQMAAWQEREPTEEEMAIFGGPVVELEVVGITRHPADLSSDDPLSFFTALPPGFLREYQGRVGEFGFRFVAVDIGQAPSPAQEAVVADAARTIVGAQAGLEEAGEQAGGPVKTTLDFVSVAMLSLAAAVGIAGFVVGGLIIVRTVSRAADDTVKLGPLGMTQRERARAVTLAVAPAAIGAGVLAAAVAIASSAFMPFGLAHRAEPDPGIHVDTPILGFGVTVTTILVLAIVAVAAGGTARRTIDRQSARPSALSRVLPASLPVGALCGLDFALGSGRGGVRAANRAASVGVALATVAGVGALVLSASIDRLFSTPADYGWSWDVTVIDDVAAELVGDPAVESVGIVTAAPISLDGRPVVTRGITSLEGELPIVIVDGRSPELGEIVLGARTMADLDVGLGETVSAQGSVGQRELRIVGEAVFAGITDTPEAGWGAAMPQAALDELGSAGDTFRSGVVALADGADADAFAERIVALTGEAPGSVEEPVELTRLREIEAFPWVLTAFLAVVGFMAIAHAILVTTRRRRSDIAVLRSLGVARRGVYAAISVQALVLAALGGLLGVPFGVAAGQALWRSVASSLGVVVNVDVPWLAIVASVVAACACVTLLALLPARAAARARPAYALRAE
jgi:hypothetical protein